MKHLFLTRREYDFLIDQRVEITLAQGQWSLAGVRYWISDEKHEDIQQALKAYTRNDRARLPIIDFQA